MGASSNDMINSAERHPVEAIPNVPLTYAVVPFPRIASCSGLSFFQSVLKNGMFDSHAVLHCFVKARTDTYPLC